EMSVRKSDSFGSSPLRLFNLADGRLLRTLPGPTGPLAVSPDGRMLAGGGPLGNQPRPVCLLELATGQERLRFGVSPLIDRPLAFCPEGRRVAGKGASKAGNTGRDAALGDVGTGGEAPRSPGPASLTKLASPPDGRTPASAASDSTTLIWDMTPTRARPPAA